MATATKTKTDFQTFLQQVHRVVNEHPVVADNTYCTWFAKGEATREEVIHLGVQFSVFSHEFLVAQLRKVLNAADMDSYRAGKEILMNELGVSFRKPGEKVIDGDVTPDQAGIEGSINGGRFSWQAAHFEWLLDFGKPLGLGFDDMGKRRHGTKPTLFFCDELVRIYGNDDPSIGEGASFAVETWAAAGFWKQLIAGLEAFKARECPELPLGFWVWHDKIEDQHAAHVTEELEQAFTTDGFDQEKFLAAAAEMLDGVKAFWDGLWADRTAS